ncbi:hypothetical protein ACFQ51_23440 [Streptomyces kaempferi]
MVDVTAGRAECFTWRYEEARPGPVVFTVFTVFAVFAVFATAASGTTPSTPAGPPGPMAWKWLRRDRDCAPENRPSTRESGREGLAPPRSDVLDHGEIAHDEPVGPSRPRGRRPALESPPRGRGDPRRRGRPCDRRGGRGCWCVRAGTRGRACRRRSAAPAAYRTHLAGG